MALRVLHCDNHCIVVDKLAGSLVQADHSGDPSLLDEVRDYVRRRFEKPGAVYIGLVHRLDRPVSGVVAFARTSKAASRLSQAFSQGRVRKEYRALVETAPVPDSGNLEHYLLKDRKRNQTRVVSAGTPGAKRARLHYETLSRHAGCALLAVKPETGRSHQIRVQLAAIGATILGDLRYGSSHPLGAWIALHALALEFPHPTQDEWVRVRSPLPDIWKTHADFDEEEEGSW